MKQKKKRKPKIESPAAFYCKDEGLYTLKELFEFKMVTVMRRTFDRNGHQQFYICEWFKPRGEEGKCWHLTKREEVLEAIELAKKHNIELYRG